MPFGSDGVLFFFFHFRCRDSHFAFEERLLESVSNTSDALRSEF